MRSTVNDHTAQRPRRWRRLAIVLVLALVALVAGTWFVQRITDADASVGQGGGAEQAWLKGNGALLDVNHRDYPAAIRARFPGVVVPATKGELAQAFLAAPAKLRAKAKAAGGCDPNCQYAIAYMDYLQQFVTPYANDGGEWGGITYFDGRRCNNVAKQVNPGSIFGRMLWSQASMSACAKNGRMDTWSTLDIFGGVTSGGTLAGWNYNGVTDKGSYVSQYVVKKWGYVRFEGKICLPIIGCQTLNTATIKLTLWIYAYVDPSTHLLHTQRDGNVTT